MRKQKPTRRTIRRFLFFPKTLMKQNGRYETRWLEVGAWAQDFHGVWLDDKWLN